MHNTLIYNISYITPIIPARSPMMDSVNVQIDGLLLVFSELYEYVFKFAMCGNVWICMYLCK